MNELLTWYLAPWRRVGRATFNTVIALASVPSLLLMLLGLAGSAGGVLGPFTDLLGASQGLQTALGGAGAPPDAQGLQQALQHMQGLSNPPPTSATPPSSNLGLWMDMLIWLALIPLVAMRLRDVGIKSNNILIGLVAVYAGMLMDFTTHLTSTHLFGWVGTVAGLVGFITLAWLCMAPSKAREMTTPPRSGHHSLNDNDPYPPFRP